jgi:hypothetical protein
MQDPFCACHSVNNHFDTAKQNYAKTPENQSMEEAKNRPPENFCLTECHAHH